MNAVPTIKKTNYLAKQNKEVLPVCETITVFTDEEIEKFKAEAYKKYPLIFSSWLPYTSTTLSPYFFNSSLKFDNEFSPK